MHRFALSCGDIPVVVCCSWLGFWGTVTSPHMWRTHIDYCICQRHRLNPLIFYQSLFINNEHGLFDSSLSCWHFLILLTIFLQKQSDMTQMTVHWWNWRAAILSSLGSVIVALREHYYMCVYVLFTKINSYTGWRINYRVGIFLWPS